MEQAKRWGLSAAQKRELWERWRRGQSSNDIARAFAKLRGSIYKVLSSSGGIEPPARRRSRLALSLAEREEIPLPVARHRPVLDLGRACADGNGTHNVAASLPARARRLGSANRPPRSQMRDELLLEHAARLHEETAVDGFVGDLHRRVARVSPHQPPGDLLR